jgi:hypothetical protein
MDKQADAGNLHAQSARLSRIWGLVKMSKVERRYSLVEQLLVCDYGVFSLTEGEEFHNTEAGTRFWRGGRSNAEVRPVLEKKVREACGKQT